MKQHIRNAQSSAIGHFYYAFGQNLRKIFSFEANKENLLGQIHPKELKRNISPCEMDWRGFVVGRRLGIYTVQTTKCKQTLSTDILLPDID